MTLPLITDVSDLKGKRVLLRLDLNVPLERGRVRDSYRIDRSLPTLTLLRERGAKTVVVSHIGKGAPSDTLRPVAEYLNQRFPVTFLPDIANNKNPEIVASLPQGEVVLLENVRHDKGEETNDPAFAARLAALADIYVNDAFSVSHRTHASIVGVPGLLPHYAGILLYNEVTNLAKAFHPDRPFLFILGGAKIGTKMPLLKKFLGRADRVFVGGAIANNFLKAAGHEIGKSLYDEGEIGGLAELLTHERLVIPRDVVVKNASGSDTRSVDMVTEGDMIVDVGGVTIQELERTVGEARLIVWNGPLGFYEEGFTEGTRELLSLIAGSRATSIIGGGDTVALIDEMGMLDRFSFVSTGGGAMLDYLAHETLPGIEALMR